MNLLHNKLILVSSFIAIVLGVCLWTWRDQLFHFGAQPDENALETAELDPIKQKMIWDNEHITFQIEKRLGTAFLRALVENKPAKVEALLLTDFWGKAVVRKNGRKRGHGPVSEIRWEANKGGSKKVDGRELAAALIADLAPFEKIDRTMLRVLRIQKLTGNKNNWKAKLLLGFAGADKKGIRLLLESEQWVECVIGDAAKIDRVPTIKRWDAEYIVLRRCAFPLMEEVTKAYKLHDLKIVDNWDLLPADVFQNRFQIAVADYNKDGFLDVAVAEIGQRPRLLESVQGKHFIEVAQARGVVQPSSFQKLDYVAGWIDYDNDGFPDLLMNGRLYSNEGGKRFADVTAQSGLTFAPECMGVTVADYDCDGRLDLYVLYQRDYGGAPARQEKWVNDEDSGQFNQLWRNQGNGRFRDVTNAALAGGGKRHTHAAAWFFYDGDRFPDLYLANDFGQNVLLRNRGDGTFEDVSATSGAASFATSMGVISGDVDNDGRPDLYVANMFSKMGRRIIGQLTHKDYPPGIYEQIQGSCAGNQLYLRKSAKRYRDFSTPFAVNKVGWAYGPAMVDIDGDGWLDLYATTGFMSFQRNKPDG